MASLDRAQLVRAAAEAMSQHRAEPGPDDGWACSGCDWTGYDLGAFWDHQHGAQVDAVLALAADDIEQWCTHLAEQLCPCNAADRLRALTGEAQP